MESELERKRKRARQAYQELLYALMDLRREERRVGMPPHLNLQGREPSLFFMMDDYDIEPLKEFLETQSTSLWVPQHIKTSSLSGPQIIKAIKHAPRYGERQVKLGRSKIKKDLLPDE